MPFDWTAEAKAYLEETTRGKGLGAIPESETRSAPSSSVVTDQSLEAPASPMLNSLEEKSHEENRSPRVSVSGLGDETFSEEEDDAEVGDQVNKLGVDRWLSPDMKEKKPGLGRRVSIRIRPRQITSYDTTDHALSCIRSIAPQVDSVVEIGEDLPADVLGNLKQIKELVTTIVARLEDEMTTRDSRTDVQALLDLENVNWDFNNDEVNNYRARANRVHHATFQYKQWHAPSFLSNYPLPPIKGKVLITVSFPVSESSLLRHIKVELKPDDSVAHLMERAINEFHKKVAKMQGKDHLGAVDDYVLKAKGYQEYLDPRDDSRVFDHEYIRESFRNRLSVDLAMVPRMPVWQPDEKEDEHALTYQEKVVPELKVLSQHEHQDLAGRFASMSWLERSKLPFVPMSAIPQYFRVQIWGLDNVDKHRLPRLEVDAVSVLRVEAFLFHGTQVLPNGVGETPTTPLSRSPRWRHWITNGPSSVPIGYNQIPRESRIAFLVHQEKIVQREQDREKPTLLAYVVHQLVDVQGFLTSGELTLSLWPLDKPTNSADAKIWAKKEHNHYFIFRATNRENGVTKKHATRIQVRFPSFVQPVVAPIIESVVIQQKRMSRAQTGGGNKLARMFDQSDVKKKLQRIVVDTEDLFYHLTPEDKELLSTKAQELCSNANMLPKYLLSVDWSSPHKRQEAYGMLQIWSKPQPHKVMGLALELLGAHYADYRVRQYAVDLMQGVANNEVQLYLLQLAQCLKVEPYHDSPLARFLISHSLANPYQFGHHFFWTLKAELNWQNPDFAERYGVILEEYLSHAGSFAQELRKQNNTVLRLQRVAEHIAHLKVNLKQSKKQCMNVYVEQLKKLNITFFNKMGMFHPPLNPKLQIKDLIIDKCRFMSSKKVPLLLWYNNADEEAPPMSIIFKSGDDLRQDILTLQLLRVMDKIWLAEGLDMYMKPYTCIATGINGEGEGVGMIETVTESETVADIQWTYGGEQPSAAFTDNVIDLYLREFNKGAEYQAAVDRFMRSCAGYCVATYLLGIGDRHNDNYMVRKDGVFFHIDFGHFLGNWKYKLGICRERTKFVFTPEMCYVMGGKNGKKYKDFQALCQEALCAARKHGRLLESLFSLMVSAGMPELVIEDDVHYLRDRLMLGEKGAAVKKVFLKELKACLNDRVRRIDNQFHLRKHKG